MAYSRLMMAVAGSGKTYYIANELNENKNNIIISFTRRNVMNINKEVTTRFGYIPKNTQILTYTTFVYRWLLKPIEPILKVGKQEGISTRGIDLNEPEPQRKNGKANYLYHKDNKVAHYVSYLDKYYSSRMSKLFIKQSKNVINNILKRLGRFCDAIYIDEAQDFWESDFKLLLELMKYKEVEIVAVGDFYQHSVSKSDFKATRPFKIKKRDISKQEYKNNFSGIADIDETTLLFSRRSPKAVCEFIKDKLNIDIKPYYDYNGTFKRLTNTKDIHKVLKDKDVTKLIYNNNVKHTFSNFNTWSYCKGDTYEAICILLTQSFNNIFDENFKIEQFTAEQRNKLYVALTRANYKIYLITHRDYKAYVNEKS